MGKRATYRVIRSTTYDVFTDRAKAIKFAKLIAATEPVYVLQQNAFDAWNTGVEIFRADDTRTSL